MLEIWKYKDHTKTTGLIIHTLELGLGRLHVYGYQFKDAYLDDHGKEKEYADTCIYVKLEKIKDKVQYEKELILYLGRNGLLIDHYDVDDDFIAVIKIPELYVPDIRLFILGKYSKMHKDFQKPFSSKDKRYHILTKSKEYKKFIEDYFETEIGDDVEFADPPDLSKEIFRYSKEKIKEIQT